MLSYNDIYEILRKEKYSEPLQILPKNFIEDFATYVADKRQHSSGVDDLFAGDSLKDKKQLENSIAIFKELMLRRKKKLLNLVFVAAETGILKRDYETMLYFEKESFEKLVRAFEEGDRELTKMLQNGGKQAVAADPFKMILFTQSVEQFVDMSGNTVGPFNAGQLANIDSGVGEILVSSGKASFVDEN